MTAVTKVSGITHQCVSSEYLEGTHDTDSLLAVDTATTYIGAFTNFTAFSIQHILSSIVETLEDYPEAVEVLKASQITELASDQHQLLLKIFHTCAEVLTAGAVVLAFKYVQNEGLTPEEIKELVDALHVSRESILSLNKDIEAVSTCDEDCGCSVSPTEE